MKHGKDGNALPFFMGVVMLFDIVYILKDNLTPDELRYSLRSVDRNFPHWRVWFVGGQPSELIPDGRIAHKQGGTSKWARVCSSLQKVLECSDISDPFFLFNDDFFVMKPQRGEFTNYTDGSLEAKVQRLRNRTGGSPYTSQLETMRQKLRSKNYDAISFAVHLPMLIYKEDLKRALAFGLPMYRSIVGNISGRPYRFHADVKIYDNETEPDPCCDYLSTTEESFARGAVGRFIRQAFPDPSRFEKVPPSPYRELYTEEGDIRRD